MSSLVISLLKFLILFGVYIVLCCGLRILVVFMVGMLSIGRLVVMVFNSIRFWVLVSEGNIKRLVVV